MGAKAKKAMKKKLKKATPLSSDKKESADFLVCFNLFYSDLLFVIWLFYLFTSLGIYVFIPLSFLWFYFLQPLEGGPGRKLPVQKPLESTATVLYIGRIPHGFFEKEMEGLVEYPKPTSYIQWNLRFNFFVIFSAIS